MEVEGGRSHRYWPGEESEGDTEKVESQDCLVLLSLDVDHDVAELQSWLE